MIAVKVELYYQFRILPLRYLITGLAGTQTFKFTG